MKLVTFNAKAGDRLIAFGDTILGGQTVEMSDAEAERLAADPHVSVTVSEIPKTKKRDDTTDTGTDSQAERLGSADEPQPEEEE